MSEKESPTDPHADSDNGNDEEIGSQVDSQESAEPSESEPVDEIQAALREASQAGYDTEMDFDSLSSPMPEIDEGPPAAPVDEVQEAIFSATQDGISTEVDFDTLPSPELPPEPHKVITPRRQTSSDMQPQQPAEGTTAPVPPPQQPTEPVEPEPVPKPEPKPKPPPEPLPAVPSETWLILAVFVSFRLLTVFLLRPGGYIRDWSDFDTYFGIASLSDYGLYPFLNFWLEWPPLVPWLTVGAYRLSLLLPPWPDDPRLWFILIMGVVFLLFEIGNFFLILQLARRLFDKASTISRVLWLYAGLFPPVYAMLGFFDAIALFFLLLALELLLRDRRMLSAVAVGVGIMVKLMPGLILPVAARKLWYEYRENGKEAAIEIGLYVVVCGITIIVLLAPFLYYGPEWLMASARSMMGRSSWETVWAVIEGYYGFGVVLGDRLNPDETTFAVHDGWLPWWLISLLFLGLYAFIFTRKADYGKARNVVAFSGLTLVVFMVYSKGYSPQFLVYILPFILLIMPNGRGLTYALILAGLNVLEQPIFFVILPNETWLLTLVVIVRLLMWLVLALEFGLVLWPVKESQESLARVHQLAPRILGGLAVIALVLLVPVTINAYNTSQLEDSPLKAFAGFMEMQAENNPGDTPARLLLSNQATYRQVYPHLNDTFDLQLTDGPSREFPEAASTTDLIRGQSRVWILPTGVQNQALANTVAQRGTQLATYNFDGIGTASLYSFEANPQPFIPLARFFGGVELLGYQADVDDGVTVTLYWRATAPQNQNLTVFTQVLNEAGELVSSHDSVPNAGRSPVTEWPIGAVQVDNHHIEIPSDLAAGDYTLVIGLYNDANERIRGIDPEGFGFGNRAVPLEVLRFN